MRTEPRNLEIPDGFEPPPAEMLIGGVWGPAQSGAQYQSTDPSTEAVIGNVPDGGAVEAAAAVAAANEAFGDWSSRTSRERAETLREVGDLILQRAETLAILVSIEQGKPIVEARNEVAFAADFLFWYAEEARRAYGEWIPDPRPDRRLMTVQQPIGVVAAITPWNVPVSMIARKAAPALAAGCTIVVKPAPETSLSGLAFARVFHDAGIPAGVFNVVTGDAEAVGQAWLTDERVRKISFTGSTEVGELLMRGSAQHVKRVSLELGGNAPFIIFPDANLGTVAADLASTKFRNAGQTCISSNRVYVHASLLKEVEEIAVGIASGLHVGRGLDTATNLGPLINRRAVERLDSRVRAAVGGGAEVLVGGEVPSGAPYDKGHFYPPTVLTGVQPDMQLATGETFGPVMSLIPFQAEREVIRAANATSYGLAAYLYTENLSRAIRVAERLEVGMVGINDQRISTVEAPFGGMKHSGLGREGGRQGLLEFLETKLIAIGVTPEEEADDEAR